MTNPVVSNRSKGFLKPLSLLFLLIFALSSVCGQVSDVANAFINISDEYYQTVNREQRQLLVRDFVSGSRSGIVNQLRGRTKILDLRPENDWMRIRNSESATLEVKLLRINGQVRFNVLVFTACAPVCSSHVGLFDAGWNLLQVPILPEVSVEQFLDPDAVAQSGLSLSSVLARFDFPMITYTFADDGQSLSVELQSEQLADDESRPALAKFLATRRMTFFWDQMSGRFVKQ